MMAVDGMHTTTAPIQVRPARRSDREAVLELLAVSLGWASDQRHEAFFDWKHEQNPFGRSPAWVALDDGAVVGFRTFMRWVHRAPSGELLPAVRAVDTATRPSHQGRGIFRQLTLQALDDLRTQGIAFVFNTPNDQSRPGYLKMGWVPVGRLPATVRVSSLASAARLPRARVPAELWSAPVPDGRPAPEVLADPRLSDLLASAPPAAGLATHRTSEYMRWRYGFADLAYGAITLDDDLRCGVAVFRLRRRGPALECALCDVIAPAGDRGAARELVLRVARECGADYVIRIGGPAVDRSGFVRIPRQGPMLTWHALANDPPGGRLDDWALTLGDVELF
jgi:GNAT superfamily N-acetyltransferase